jgi:hypothetical protein
MSVSLGQGAVLDHRVSSLSQKCILFSLPLKTL